MSDSMICHCHFGGYCDLICSGTNWVSFGGTYGNHNNPMIYWSSRTPLLFSHFLKLLYFSVISSNNQRSLEKARFKERRKNISRYCEKILRLLLYTFVKDMSLLWVFSTKIVFKAMRIQISIWFSNWYL